MHLQSLDAFEFDSILTPYNHTMRQQPEYAADLERLIDVCTNRRVAVQTIKAVARRRWSEGDPDKRFSWYMPIRDPEALIRAVHYVLGRPGLFLNTTSDATILGAIFAASARRVSAPSGEIMAQDAAALDMQPLFVRDVSDEVRVG